MACTTIDPLDRQIRLRINGFDHTKTSLEDLRMIFLRLRSLLTLSSYQDGLPYILIERAWKRDVNRKLHGGVRA